MSINIQIAKNKEEWADNVLQGIVTRSKQAIAARGQFTLVLSGGSTPAPVYRALGDAALDWEDIYLFWGDERCVPPDHPESNYKMTAETLLNHIPIPAENIYRMQGEEPPEKAAQIYETELEKFFSGREKQFDLVLLGLGNDGHTASLFPNTPALHEQKAWVVQNQHPDSGMWRISLTYPAILSARYIFFLVQGAGKAQVVADVISNPEKPPHYPAKEIRNASGEIVWYLDEQAAKFL